MMNSTILVIEEYKDLRLALCGWLQTAFPDVQVVEAADQAEALGLAQTRLPDVVIVSHSAVGGHDLLAVQQLKAQLPVAAILVLASFVEDSYRARAIAAGANVVISTEYVTQELASTLPSLFHSPLPRMKI